MRKINKAKERWSRSNLEKQGGHGKSCNGSENSRYKGGGVRSGRRSLSRGLHSCHILEGRECHQHHHHGNKDKLHLHCLHFRQLAGRKLKFFVCLTLKMRNRRGVLEGKRNGSESGKRKPKQLERLFFLLLGWVGVYIYTHLQELSKTKQRK